MEVSSEVKVIINEKERCFRAYSNFGLHEMQGTNHVFLCEGIPNDERLRIIGSKK